MTDEQIIKALELHSDIESYCTGICPYSQDGYCGCLMAKDAIDLINRQKAEIAKLKAENEEQDQAIINALCRMGEIRAEAIKEFAERANEKLSYYLEKCGDFAPYGMADIIDNLVKEMTEDEGK